MVILPNRRKYMVGRIPSGATVPMSECVVTLANDHAQYTGSARTVGVSVTWNGATLAVNTDYMLSWANNVNVGPATVTVTGVGQFSGSVTRTFYITEIVGPAWDFDLTKTTTVGGVSISSTNLSYTLPLVENYDAQGNAMVPVHYFLNNNFVSGFPLPKDANGELHVENINPSSPTVLDIDGAGGDYLHPFHFDNARSFWYSNGGSYVLKAKDGTESPSFEGEIDAYFRGMLMAQFVNGGRRLFAYQANNKVYSFDLVSRYNIETLDVGSKRAAVVGDDNDKVRFCSFCSSGTQALVSKVSSSYIFHFSCPTPYSLENATEISRQSFGSTISHVQAINIVNGGGTLIMSGGNKVYEYDLSA